MAIPAGKAIVELELVGENAVDKKLKGINARLLKFGPAMAAAAAAATAAIAATATAAFAKLTELSVKAASDFEEVRSKFEVVFGSMSRDVEAWAESYGQAVGRSKKATMEYLASMQDLLVPMGVAPDEAERLSKSLVSLAADLASFNNDSDAEAVERLQAALAGSGEVMKRYGVILNETTTKQELLNQGIDPKNATNAEKAIARYNIILRGTTAAQNDAINTADSFANQQKRVQAAFDDLLVVVGQQIVPVLQRLMAVILAVGDVIRTDVEDGINQAGDAAQEATNTFEDMASIIELIVRGMSASIGVTAEMAAGFLSLAATAQAAAAAYYQFDSAKRRAFQDNEGAEESARLSKEYLASSNSLFSRSIGLASTGSRALSVGFGLEGVHGGQGLGDRIREQMAGFEKRREELLAEQANLYTPTVLTGAGGSAPGVSEEEKKRLAALADHAEKQREAMEQAKREDAENKRRERDARLASIDEYADALSDRFRSNFDELTSANIDKGVLESIDGATTDAYRVFAENEKRVAGFQDRQAKLMEEQVKLSKELTALMKERQLVVGVL